MFTALFTIAVDAAELILVQHGVFSINGVLLPPAAQMMAQISANLPFAGPLAMAALQAGITAGNSAVHG